MQTYSLDDSGPQHSFMFVLCAFFARRNSWSQTKTKQVSHDKTFDKTKENMAAELEDTLKRLVQNKAVIGTMVTNSEGVPIKSTLDVNVATQYSGLINQLVDQGRVILKICLCLK